MDNLIGVCELDHHTVALIWDRRSIRIWRHDGDGRYKGYHDGQSYDEWAWSALERALDGNVLWMEGPRWCPESRRWAQRALTYKALRRDKPRRRTAMAVV